MIGVDPPDGCGHSFLRLMTDRLNFVAVQVADSGGIIGRVIICPQAGQTFVSAAKPQGRFVKPVHRITGFRQECGLLAIAHAGFFPVERALNIGNTNPR